jgi:hypothetical protein
LAPLGFPDAMNELVASKLSDIELLAKRDKDESIIRGLNVNDQDQSTADKIKFLKDKLSTGTNILDKSVKLNVTARI